MSKMQLLKTICWNTLRVTLFYLLMLWWGFQLDPMLSELFVITPFIVFAPVSLFLFLFLCRETGCLMFMDKGRLKAILRNNEPEPSASQIVLKFFSWPFLKRVCMFFGLFILEFYLRLFAIKLFLVVVQETLPLWEKITNVSEVLLYVLMALTAYVIMELPAWLLFYKLSFKGHSNRSYEYRFGIKLSVFVAMIIGLRVLSLYLTRDASSAAELALFVLSAGIGFGLWYLMYRKKCCCHANGCPICRAFKKLFAKKTVEKPSEDTVIIETIAEEKE